MGELVRVVSRILARHGVDSSQHLTCVNCLRAVFVLKFTQFRVLVRSALYFPSATCKDRSMGCTSVSDLCLAALSAHVIVTVRCISLPLRARRAHSLTCRCLEVFPACTRRREALQAASEPW